jgi:hypothetical protein
MSRLLLAYLATSASAAIGGHFATRAWAPGTDRTAKKESAWPLRTPLPAT